MAETDVNAETSLIARKQGAIGRITLNRPGALNALNTEMVLEMTRALLAWRDDESIKAVVVEGAGERAFCAGGDIIMIAESGRAGDGRAVEFWREEYKLNVLIKRYPKPYLAMIDGVTMGGGVGVSLHGSHRVAGDKTLLAMPETGIGFYPDVGGTYFLPRLDGEVGMWLGLTGARLKAADCLHVGAATHFIVSERQDGFVNELARAHLDERGGVVDALLAEYASDPGEAPAASARALIDATFAGDSVEGVIAALERDGSDWALKQRDVLATKSPTSMKLTMRALREGASMKFEDAMRRELALSARCLDGNDFYEGVRAVLIDRDNAPDWRPAHLQDVSEADIGRFFAGENMPEITFFEDA